MAALLAIVGLVGLRFMSCAAALIVSSESAHNGQAIRVIGSDAEFSHFRLAFSMVQFLRNATAALLRRLLAGRSREALDFRAKRTNLRRRLSTPPPGIQI